jgi:hypothetical protein
MCAPGPPALLVGPPALPLGCLPALSFLKPIHSPGAPSSFARCHCHHRCHLLLLLLLLPLLSLAATAAAAASAARPGTCCRYLPPSPLPGAPAPLPGCHPASPRPLVLALPIPSPARSRLPRSHSACYTTLGGTAWGLVWRQLVGSRDGDQVGGAMVDGADGVWREDDGGEMVDDQRGRPGHDE